jgi:hypothetical protein
MLLGSVKLVCKLIYFLSTKEKRDIVLLAKTEKSPFSIYLPTCKQNLLGQMDPVGKAHGNRTLINVFICRLPDTAAS